MGVQGLSSFIEANSQIYRDVRFRDSRLVIDGCNLCCLLYFNSGLDQKHGGEYGAFADLIERFVTALRDCGIEPYVVLDGGDDHTDKKLETLRKRAERQIRTAHEMSLGRQGNILPPLGDLLFIQTLARLEVPVAVSFSEADQQIAALASEWKCPVLSNDSDFYIFDLPAGLLPLSHFQWEAVAQSGSQSYIPCKSYTASSFCTFFNIQRQMLPVFAALAGNDYVKLGEMGLTPRWGHSTPTALGTGSAGRLEELLRWLRGFQRPREAIEAAVMLMGNLSRQREAEVLQGLSLGTEEYQLPPSYLNRFFTDGTVPPLPPEAQGLVPDWARLPLTQGRLTEDTLNVLLLRRVRLRIMVDHGRLPSANLTSRPVRQVMYGLLLGGGRRVPVEENDREGLLPAKVMVRPVCRGAAQALKLDSLHKADPSRGFRVLMEALGVNPSYLSEVDPQLRLPVAVTCYWLQQSSPPPDLKLLQALLLELVTKQTERETAGSGALQSEHRHPPHRTHHDVAHAYNQWQACLKDSIHLNQLLGFPLPEPQIAWLYQGTLVCQMVHRLRKGTHPALLLRRQFFSLKLYRKLLTVVLQARGQETTASSAAGKGRNVRQQHPTQSLDDLTADLEQQFLLDEDEEATAAVKSSAKAEEDRSWELVSVRTRYRAKGHSHRPKIPELARKRESRGWD